MKKKKYKVLIATSTFGSYSTKPILKLRKNNFDIIKNTNGRKLTKYELLKKAKNCDAIIAGTEEYSDITINKLAKLKVISRLGVGKDNINLKECAKKKIKVYTTKTSPSKAVSELALGLLIDLNRNITYNDKAIRKGIWKKNYGNIVSSKTLGIIGLGNVGKELIKITSGFNLNYLAYDSEKDHKFSKKYNVKYCSINEIFKNSDFISVHISLNRYTQNLITKSQLRKMKSDSIIINTSRGEIINEKDIYESLKSKKIKGAAFDVFHMEPYKGKLTNLNNVVLTPHIGSYAIEVRKIMEEECVNNIVECFNEL